MKDMFRSVQSSTQKRPARGGRDVFSAASTLRLFQLAAILGVAAGCPAAPPADEARTEGGEETARAEQNDQLAEIDRRLESIELRLAALESAGDELDTPDLPSDTSSDVALDDQDAEPPVIEEGEDVAIGEGAGDGGPTPIAGWNWVPWEEVTPGMQLGVVAFHIDGVDRVEFRFTGCVEPVVATVMSMNEDSGTVEYYAAVPEGATEVEAVVYGTRGPPCILVTRPFNPPIDDVLILKGQRIEGPIDPAGKRHLWLQDCELVGGLHWSATTFQSIYAIDCRASGPDRFFQKVELVRNCVVDGFSSDAFRDCRMVINCTAKNQTRINEQHPDVVQFYLAAENAIVYGLTAVENIGDQGLFSRGKGVEHHGVAIVNCRYNLSGFPDQNQWGTRTHHFVVEGNEFLGAPFTSNMDDTVATGFRGSTDVVFRDNTFQWVNIDGEGAEVRAMFRDNRFINRWPAYVPGRAGREVGELIGEGAVLLRNQ